MGSNLPAQTDREYLDGLSGRERQLLQLAAKGHTDQAIANNLGISLATVGTYWGRVRIKLGPFNRTELVAKYLRAEAEHVVGRLKEENKILIKEIEQHTKTEQMLRVSLEMFRGLIESAPDAILLISADGTIQFANAQSTEMFGFTQQEFVGMSVEKLVPERYRVAHVDNRDEYNSNPIKRQMGEHLATMALRKDGTEFPMATALSATKTPNGLLVTCIVRDLTAMLSKPASA